MRVWTNFLLICLGYTIVQVPNLMFSIYDFLKRNIRQKTQSPCNVTVPVQVHSSSTSQNAPKSSIYFDITPKLTVRIGSKIVEISKEKRDDAYILRQSLDELKKEIIDLKKKMIADVFNLQNSLYEIEKRSERIINVLEING